MYHKQPYYLIGVVSPMKMVIFPSMPRAGSRDSSPVFTYSTKAAMMFTYESA